MQVRGNYKLFYFIEILTGILLIFLFHFFGEYGLDWIDVIFYWITSYTKIKS